MKINPYLMFNGNCEAAFKFIVTAAIRSFTALSENGETGCKILVTVKGIVIFNQWNEHPGC